MNLLYKKTNRNNIQVYHKQGQSKCQFAASA